jgi:hypothetical protein
MKIQRSDELMATAAGAKSARETQTTTATVTGKRLNLILSDRAFQDLTGIAKKTKRTMTEVVRLGVGLVKLVLEESEKGNKLIITTYDGKALREIVIPS